MQFVFITTENDLNEMWHLLYSVVLCLVKFSLVKFSVLLFTGKVKNIYYGNTYKLSLVSAFVLISSVSAELQHVYIDSDCAKLIPFTCINTYLL